MDPVRTGLILAPGEPTAVLLDALDRVREVRGSVALFDALAAEDPNAVFAALAGAPRHPLRARLVVWLAARGVAEPETEGAAAALARHGITDLDAWILARDRNETQLSRALDAAQTAKVDALRAANAYALMAALLAILAIGGWVAALGGLPQPVDATTLPTPSGGDAEPEAP